MIKRIINTAIRHLLKDKAFSFINFTSLVIRFATFCLISMIIFYEFNWDKHNTNYEKAGFYSEQTIFDIFTFHFIEGTSENALINPTSIVLSKTMAAKIFPEGKALGKQVFIEKKYPLTVAGVYDDLPLNTFFRPAYIRIWEFIISLMMITKIIKLTEFVHCPIHSFFKP